MTYVAKRTCLTSAVFENQYAARGEKMSFACPHVTTNFPFRRALSLNLSGGKRGVEIEGAADMGGLQFFCTNVACTKFFFQV